jgi:hypothetical protein
MLNVVAAAVAVAVVVVVVAVVVADGCLLGTVMNRSISTSWK